MPELKLVKDFKAARRAAVPILFIETADPASCIRQIRGIAKTAPLIQWDKSQGFTPKNKEGEAALISVLGPAEDGQGDPTNNWLVKEPEDALREASRFPGKSSTSGGTVLFFMNAHLFLNPQIHNETAAVMQSMWNLRDIYKQNTRTLVCFAPEISLPAELKQDVLVLEDPLPTDEELSTLIRTIYKSAQQSTSSLPDIDDATVKSSAEATKGLSSFQAEQVFAMSITEKGVDLESAWDKKRKTIEQTPGMRIWRGKETFNDVRGCNGIKSYLTDIMLGEDAPTVLAFWDEMEKMFAGTMGDLSGTTQEMHGQILSWMVDEEILALMMIGHPGCSKSYIVKALAGQFKKHLVMMNISELKGGIIGQSTAQTRAALRMLSAIGRPLVIGTCNNLDTLSPELKDRFKLGTFFFDLPSAEERAAVWEIWMSKYKLSKQAIDWDEGWTPRNIRDCCELSWRLKKPLSVVKEFIVPVCRSNPKRIEELRRMADGKFLSSSKPGIYEMPSKMKFTDDQMRSIGGSGIGEA